MYSILVIHDTHVEITLRENVILKRQFNFENLYY